LEQVISSSINSDNGSGNMDSLGPNGQSSLNGNSVYNFGHDQNSDFMLNGSATTNELMKMMANATNLIEANISSKANTLALNKRKNSERTRQDDDESKKNFNIFLSMPLNHFE